MTESTKKTLESELKAIKAIIEALEGLDSPTKHRVLSYALGHLDISFAANRAPEDLDMSAPVASNAPAVLHSVLETKASPISDIRTLKETKQPKSANEMAALVAYYLSEIVQGEEKKLAINTKDIEKYFKQAGFALPTATRVTLGNAANAGYFDKTGDGYKLNPVGYNLVVHGLPSKEGAPTKKSKKKKSKK